jgi:Resolvase, N terminal domain
MKIGYARVSTDEQNLGLQLDALHADGCERVFQDTASGARSNRKGLTDALQACSPGDVLTVWKLDRLGRSLLDLVGHAYAGPELTLSCSRPRSVRRVGRLNSGTPDDPLGQKVVSERPNATEVEITPKDQAHPFRLLLGDDELAVLDLEVACRHASGLAT